MTAVLSQLSEAVDALVAVDPNGLTDAGLHELVVELVDLESRFALQRARLLAAWDGRKVWADDGSKAGWGRLARECHLSEQTAKHEMSAARQLASMPNTVSVVEAGKLSMCQARLLRWANQPAIAEVFAAQERFLIDMIQGMRLPDAKRAVDYWITGAYESLGLTRPHRSREGRHMQVVRTFYDHVDVKGRLDPLAGTEVLTELHRIERDLFEADWAAIRAEHGKDALPSQLPRTSGQRMADALQLMARNSAAYREGQHRQPRPLINIHAGMGTFARMCELADGTVISPEQAVPYLLEGDIERIVFDSPSRVIDVGVRERFFTGALRRAIQVRDRHCQDPSGCDVPAEDCDIDHKIPYSQGGETTQANGECKCHTHNLRRNNHPDPEPPQPEPDDTS